MFEFDEFNGADSFKPPFIPLLFSSSSSASASLLSSSSYSPISEMDLSKIARKRLSNIKLPRSIIDMNK